MHIRSFGCIIATVFVLAILIPGSANAQNSYANYTGEVNESTIVTDQYGNVISSTSSTYVGGMSITFDLGANMSIGDIQLFGGFDTYHLGPQSGSGSTNQGGYNYSFAADFAITYKSISSNGTIDTTGGVGFGDISQSFNYSDGSSLSEFASFQPVPIPEPSSLILSATAVTMIASLAWFRRSRSNAGVGATTR